MGQSCYGFDLSPAFNRWQRVIFSIIHGGQTLLMAVLHPDLDQARYR